MDAGRRLTRGSGACTARTETALAPQEAPDEGARGKLLLAAVGDARDARVGALPMPLGSSLVALSVRAVGLR
ncbi:hypothetical protein PF003_g1065 [Phytophthora fragariae]|nr:hypothetical protein PF003_g1065 [Phytophthora fragariae]